MDRKNKKVDDFANALMQNTRLLKTSEKPGQDTHPQNEHHILTEIDKKTFSKFKILALYYKQSPEELMEEALNHYLRLKRRDLQKAVFELTKDE